MSDLILTWPKKRSLSSYLKELDRAWGDHEFAFFKVSSSPQRLGSDSRSYMVHDGAIRGWLQIIAVAGATGQIDSVTGKPFPKGIYIIRDPSWHPIEPIPMKGFRGFRYTERLS